MAVYAVFALAASSRAAYQLATRFDDAPVAFLLSALAAAVYVLATVALLLAVSAFAFAARDRLPPKAHLLGLLLLQVLVVVQAMVALVRIGDWGGPIGELLGYLAMALVLVPGAMALTVEERNRWGTNVLGVACLVLTVVLLRLQSIWESGA